MRQRRTLPRKPAEQDELRCRDCAHSYDWHEIGANGAPFLARCPYRWEGGKWCIFLSDRACENFKKRQ